MWRRDRFSSINTRWRECAGCHTQSARVPGGDGATGRATSVPWVSGHTRCLHTCWGGAGRRGRLFRPPRSGGGSVPVAAHSLRECRGAMARRGGPLPYLGYPVTPDACTHVGAGRVGAAGFFDHREAAAGVCPWRRTVCASVGGRWRDGAGHFRTLCIRCLHACWRAKLITPKFGCRETMMGPCPWRRTVCESVRER